MHEFFERKNSSWMRDSHIHNSNGKKAAAYARTHKQRPRERPRYWAEHESAKREPTSSEFSAFVIQYNTRHNHNTYARLTQKHIAVVAIAAWRNSTHSLTHGLRLTFLPFSSRLAVCACVCACCFFFSSHHEIIQEELISHNTIAFVYSEKTWMMAVRMRMCTITICKHYYNCELELNTKPASDKCCYFSLCQIKYLRQAHKKNEQWLNGNNNSSTARVMNESCWMIFEREFVMRTSVFRFTNISDNGIFLHIHIGESERVCVLSSLWLVYLIFISYEYLI